MPSRYHARPFEAQNTQVSAGKIGGMPSAGTQQLNATVTAQSKLQNAGAIPRHHRQARFGRRDGASRRCRSRRARQRDATTPCTRANGHPASGLAVKLAPGANALTTAERVRTMVERARASTCRLATKSSIRATARAFIQISIEEVVKTLIEAIVLVVIVMFVFLQNWRATLIPAIAVPVVLLGTFGVLAGVRLLDQHADDVRDGAVYRLARGRRDRRGGERRARDARGASLAARGDVRNR